MSSIRKNRVKESLPIHFIRTHDPAGNTCYFLLRTSQSSYMKLMAKRHKEEVDIADFGEVLYSGNGSAPSEKERLMLKTKYGITIPEKL